MADQTAVLEILVHLFVIGAFLVFLASGVATLVLMVHMTSMPERRQRRPQPAPPVSFAD
jgi:hypothetical protein